MTRSCGDMANFKFNNPAFSGENVNGTIDDKDVLHGPSTMLSTDDVSIGAGIGTTRQR